MVSYTDYGVQLIMRRNEYKQVSRNSKIAEYLQKKGFALTNP